MSSFPSHVFAILSSRSSAKTPTVASFADRHSLPPSTTVPLYPAPPRRLTLPIVPLTVPSPETYALLHAYLHTMRPDTLLASLLPALAQSFPPLSAAGSSAGPGKSHYVINGLWQNVCALGVFDAELWGVMDLAWEVVLAAMTKVVEKA
ncbi:hypothetical protein C8T65DRAFT_704097 [Cerioporus squamosus]|nr:hypothetical protein C8T65DRAFT_704097 [Cerioporus squamosus]